jgi:predicted nucleotide-binding protein
MYNLLIGYVGAEDTENSVTVSASRFLEYTDSETQMRFRNLSAENVGEIKSFPALLMKEEAVGGAIVARITNITRSGADYRVTFERDVSTTALTEAEVEELAIELGIERFEFNRTHWAVKRTDLKKLLASRSAKDVPTNLEEFTVENKRPEAGEKFNKNQVFIVHGHDEHAKNDVKSYVESKGLEPIILHLQASGGRTIIEKIDHYSNVGFGIVLYTECDVGAKRDSLAYKWRARQNVVFEHGYLIAKLSRERVAAIVKGSVETPNDISGVIYVSMDAAGAWKEGLDTELRNAGYAI